MKICGGCCFDTQCCNLYQSALSLYSLVPTASQNNLVKRVAAGSGKDVRTKKLSPTSPPEKSFVRPLQAAGLRPGGGELFSSRCGIRMDTHYCP